jgi:hypothetical protein
MSTDEDFKRAEYIAGLRMLADVLETNPHLRLPFDGNVSELDVMPHGDQRQELADWARVLPGRKDKGEVAGRYLTLKGAFRGLKVKLICDREEVCERVVTGTREVTETVPDPELVAAVPVVTVTTTVEDVVWRCRPLLADADRAAGVR